MYEVTARLKVRDGELDGFKQQAAEIMRQVHEKDTKTLRYDWFMSDDGTQCEVREGYVDSDALLDHSEHVWEARTKLFHDFAYDHDMTLYGEPSPALAKALEAMSGHAVFHRYSLFQGQGSEAEPPPEGVFEAAARLKIRPGELEGFKQQATEIVCQTRANGAKPLRYDWFLSDDGAECEVREVYEDADALLDQQRRLGEAKAELFRNFVAGHHMSFYGELSPALARTMETMGAPFTRFWLFQGLGTSVDEPAKVPV